MSSPVYDYLAPELTSGADLLQTQLNNILQPRQNGAVCCWLAERDRALIPHLQQVCDRLNISLYGAVFPALIYQGTFSDRGCLLQSLPENTRAAIIPCQPQTADTVARQLETLAEPLLEQPANLMLIFDAQQDNISAILDQLYLRLHNSVRYCGANAGSERFQPIPCLFDNRRIYSYAVLALVIPSTKACSLAHGYKNFDAVTATSTTGNRIHSINWQNAFSVYRQQIAKEFNHAVNADNFYGFSAHFPFGIIRISGQPLVRIPVKLEDDGTLVCVGDIPEYTVISLLQGVEADGDETLDQLLQPLTERADAYQVFYCAGRRMHLGEKSARELTRLAARLSGSTLCGALSLGEICNEDGQGYPLFHNAAIVCCPWG